MPSFTTPDAIDVDVDLGLGDTAITASDRSDTVVTVKPTHASDPSDVTAAEQTTVDFVDGRLTVRAPKPNRFGLWTKRSPSVRVLIELPTDSRVHVVTKMGNLTGSGRLGNCTFDSGLGHAGLDATGDLDVKTATGNVTVQRVFGRAEISTGSGEIRVTELDGPATAKSSNGAIEIGSAADALRLRSSNGGIAVARARAGVTAKTANGNVRVGAVEEGAAELATSNGSLEIGIPEGTAARLDVHTGFGRMNNQLEATTSAPATDKIAEIHGRTSFGDITIHRARKESA